MIVQVENLIKRYDNMLAIDNLSLDIREGDIFGLLGPNGAGKTTLINSMLGLTKVDSGSIKIFGKDIKEHEMYVKKNIGIVPQEIALYEDLTAYENLMFFGRLYGLRGKGLKEAVESAFEFTAIEGRKNEIVKQYSGGMQRRLNIACAIVHKPKLVIMDEPTVGIDPQSRNQILNSIKRLRDNGATIIYTSHYMEEVESICNDVAIIDKGRVIAKGSKEELKDFVYTEEKIIIRVSAVSFTLVNNIKAIKGIKECEVEENLLNITSEKNEVGISSILTIIEQSGVEILSVNIEKPTLESVFITLTGRKIRD
ncbi:ABC transporter ATP-binding protein [Clostridium algidicarnis]|uniref:ABC-2 type transport system ATP-binding protein n=2 Tax=Clostridium algidicarnis TaxID=37659 RepID=A0A2S6FYD8_9CLOT|nr:ABC transporter ATP-binding protein [Clostridium algidicarnis]MBB6697947.1 ABC transporter ATP-binding protein [Clostridium algidicarnis]MBU3193170.1 ABC transporter ATP-binding protein [Clostridium algidicarnis]MBU3196212.1 ABC transporter ATP-binding protein [Clostridium algidicarnis]MBU3220617.1 ABC transporter ATP-binding protein [Clostridium algidicarnis]MCB2287274.1 ABC transporter ATP-binding protein [Clostridium algidicarnis]